MLKGRLIHPQILEALGRAGHSSKVLVADGNYPFSTKSPASATLVNLNLSPGIVDCVSVLKSLVSAVPIEAVEVMQPMSSGPYAVAGEPEIWREFGDVLASAGADLPLQPVERQDFYVRASSPDVALVIATAEQRIYANLLLTIGVVMPN